MKPRELVAVEAPNRIRDHLNRRARYNPTRSLTALTSQLTQEYEDRFLVELVQNAYDAHPPGTRDGRVYVRLDESTYGHAVLYVANKGRPFDEQNFDALTNVAQSSKPPGEGIGNKGVGFRSVLQVCDSPEIYSCDPESLNSEHFDGFCFSFATDDQIRQMVAEDSEYEIIKRDFSRYLLPVVATPTDPRLDQLRALGMVTVIRLTLPTPRAAELARTQVQRLLKPTPPIILFLDRLHSITVEHVNAEGLENAAEVDRTVIDVLTRDGGPTLRWVETVGRRFLTTTRHLPAAAVREVVAEAINLGELDQSWATWDSDAEVVLAIPGASEGLADWPSIYTYLPMRVTAPLYAYLHAPFQTKMARLSFKEESVLNTFLIRTAAQLAADTIRLLTTEPMTGLDEDTIGTAVVDLLCWDSDHLALLDAALKNLDLDLKISPLLPARGPDGAEWAALASVNVWNPTGLDVLTSTAIEAHAHLLDPSIDHDRVERLNAVAKHTLWRDLTPRDDEVAAWIENIARTLERASLNKWNRFLNEVASVFESRQPNALQGRMVLLDENRHLRRSGPWDSAPSALSEPTVFIPPQQIGSPKKSSEAELMAVPRNLQRAITFLHQDIRVRSRVGSTFKRTAIGELFQRGDLVEQFELAAVLSHLERLLAGKVSDTTYRQALSWVYTQERASRSNIADLSRLGLRVPTASGWLSANEAVFSPAWRTPRARAVAQLVKDAAHSSESIRKLGDGAILPPQDWPFRVKDSDSFCDFLARCGVRDGLFPSSLRSRTAIRMNGNNFTAATIANRFALANPEDWKNHVRETWHAVLAGPLTPYTGDQELWIIPGQEAFESLTASAKDRLAAAILESIAEWPKRVWTYNFRRRSPHHSSRPDPQTWPSPARAFVERAAWFPMSDAGHRDDRYFVPVWDGWTFDETTSETAPRFARLAPVDHRRRLATSPGARTRLDQAGLKTWNSPVSAGARFAELADLVASGQVPDAELPSVRRAASTAWSDFIGLPHAVLPPDLKLIVARGSALGLLEPSTSAPVEVFIHDSAPGLAAQVLEASNLPTLVADPAGGNRTADALAGVSGFRARLTSTVEAKVILDGQELAPSAESGSVLLDVFGVWLIRTMLAIVDIRSTRFVRVTDKVLHDAEARLRRMRLIIGSSIDLTVDKQMRSATGRLAECVHIDDPEHPLLVLNGNGVEVPSWRALEMLSDDLADLMGQAQVASEIRAAALTFQRTIAEWREPSDAEIAKVLRCSVESVSEVLTNLRSSSDHLRWLLAPFVGVLAGADAAHRVEIETAGDLADLQSLLRDLIGDDHAAELLASSRLAESIDGIRRDIGVDLGQLNVALAELGRPPLHFADLHRSALQSYLNEHRVELLGVLRQQFLSAFKAHADLSAYTAARDFHDIAPSPAWLDTHEVPTEDMMQELLSQWLAGKGESRQAIEQLTPIDQVRGSNHSLLDRCLPRAARVITAWCAKSGLDVPEAWSDLEQIRTVLETSGCLDFEEFDEANLLAWLARLGLWPIGMDNTLDPVKLDLSEADLAATSRSTGAENRRRRRTELSFGERTFDTATDELRELIDAVAASVDDDFLRTKPTPANLSDITSASHSSGGSGTRNAAASRSYGSSKLSHEQATAVGLAGEALAYRWLQHTYEETTPDSWVSANRAFHLGGHPGDDTLGYDFRIARKSETLYFEVKATTTGEYEFDIGESELRAARAARKGWYRIIFIKSIFVPAERQLFVLPNPLEPEFVTSFSQINQGIRLRFCPTSAES